MPDKGYQVTATTPSGNTSVVTTVYDKGYAESLAQSIQATEDYHGSGETIQVNEVPPGS